VAEPKENLMMGNDIATTLAGIVGDLTQDWGIDTNGGITGKTRLVHDLEFASVDIIQLCVAIEQHYGRKFGFQDLLMKNGSYISDLTISQMADFLGGRLQGGGGK
jgi:acyl carrier protein